MNEPLRKIKRLELAVMIAGLMLLAALFVFGSRSSGASVGETKPAVSEAQDFSRFQHSNPMHARMPCLLCHKKGRQFRCPKAFRPHAMLRLPRSAVCRRHNRISPFCHTNAATGAVKRFLPGCKVSAFASTIRGMSVRRTPLRVTSPRVERHRLCRSPSGVGAHTTCYQCHGPRTEVGGRNIGSCGTCHVPGHLSAEFRRFGGLCQELRPWRTSASGNLNCSSCHTVRPGSARGRQVSSPAVSMHFAAAGTLSCGACHNNKRRFWRKSFYRLQSRCHQNGSFLFGSSCGKFRDLEVDRGFPNRGLIQQDAKARFC